VIGFTEMRIMPKFDSPDSRLKHWLDQRGLRENPFAHWNAEWESDLPEYFVEVGQFDELLRAREPGIVFAERGCGKTAQRQMLAAQCRPVKHSSPRLAVTYTYGGFEQALMAVKNDLDRLSSIDHIRALLPLGLAALAEEAAQDPEVRSALADPKLGPRWEAYVSYFAPQLEIALTGTSSFMDRLNSMELIGGFVELVRGVGLQSCVIFVDGVDEFPLVAEDVKLSAKFLAPLLGTLPLIEYPGLAFKFFLPQRLESALRACSWFRTDRLHLSRIAWNDQSLLELLRERLAHFSFGQSPYQALGQLCEDELAQVIDRELVDLSGKVPRAVLMLADLLLQSHCRQPRPPDLITLETWRQIKLKWMDLRLDFIRQENGAERPEARPIPTADAAPLDLLVLTIDEEKGLVWLGPQEIRKEITPKDYSVLLCLYRHKGAVCSKDLLARDAWPEVENDDAVSDETIAASIARLRKLFKTYAPDREFVQTLKGKKREQGGYKLYPNGV
jgi:hypothetical protein